MKKTLIVYGSTMGRTEAVAGKIKAQLPEAALKGAGNVTTGDLKEHEVLILGSSTWGYGEMQDDWGGLLADIERSDLSGKTVALFGSGDQMSYSDTFVDAIGLIYEAVLKAGGKVVGFTSTDGFNFSGSKAVVDGKFAGLVFDDDNQPELTDERFTKWFSDVAPHTK